MKQSKSKFLWLFLGTCLALAILWESVPLKDSQDRLDTFPKSGFGFVTQEIPVSSVERRVFKECNLLKLYIRQGKQSYLLTAIDGTENRNAVHDARLCFIGSGWTITNERIVTIPGGNSAIITLEKAGRRREVMMWFSDGEYRYGSALKYWIASALRRLTFGMSGEEPIRIIIQPTDDRALDWDDIINNLSPLWSL